MNSVLLSVLISLFLLPLGAQAESLFLEDLQWAESHQEDLLKKRSHDSIQRRHRSYRRCLREKRNYRCKGYRLGDGRRERQDRDLRGDRRRDEHYYRGSCTVPPAVRAGSCYLTPQSYRSGQSVAAGTKVFYMNGSALVELQCRNSNFAIVSQDVRNCAN